MGEWGRKPKTAEYLLLCPISFMSIFGSCQMVLNRTKYQGPFAMNQMSPWMFWTGSKCPANIKDLWAWTKILMDILDRTKYQGLFGLDQMSYRCFG